MVRLSTKKDQLGMDPGTASGRLVKDLLWKYLVIARGDLCSKCRLPMSRSDFSVEHIEPWMHSEDPSGLFFDLDNIDFSHHRCNVGSARQANKKYADRSEKSRAAWQRQKLTRVYDPEKRRAQYERTGK